MIVSFQTNITGWMRYVCDVQITEKWNIEQKLSKKIINSVVDMLNLILFEAFKMTFHIDNYRKEVKLETSTMSHLQYITEARGRRGNFALHLKEPNI